VAIPAAWS